jgi:transcription elongation factor Elf1
MMGNEIELTAATAIAAEGARVGVVSCRLCGAALLLDPREGWDNIGAHKAWHDAHEQRVD